MLILFHFLATAEKACLDRSDGEAQDVGDVADIEPLDVVERHGQAELVRQGGEETIQIGIRVRRSGRIGHLLDGDEPFLPPQDGVAVVNM